MKGWDFVPFPLLLVSRESGEIRQANVFVSNKEMYLSQIAKCICLKLKIVFGWDFESFPLLPGQQRIRRDPTGECICLK